jgi:hypothetical protein
MYRMVATAGIYSGWLTDHTPNRLYGQQRRADRCRTRRRLCTWGVAFLTTVDGCLFATFP